MYFGCEVESTLWFGGEYARTSARLNVSRSTDETTAAALPALSYLLVHTHMQRLFTLTAANCLPSAGYFTFSFLPTARSVAATMLSRSHTNSHWACNCCALALAYTRARRRRFYLRWSLLLLSYGALETATASIFHSLLATAKRTVLVRSWLCTKLYISGDVWPLPLWLWLLLLPLPFGSSAVPAVSLFLRFALSCRAAPHTFVWKERAVGCLIVDAYPYLAYVQKELYTCVHIHTCIY